MGGFFRACPVSSAPSSLSFPGQPGTCDSVNPLGRVAIGSASQIALQVRNVPALPAWVGEGREEGWCDGPPPPPTGEHRNVCLMVLWASEGERVPADPAVLSRWSLR